MILRRIVGGFFILMSLILLLGSQGDSEMTMLGTVIIVLAILLILKKPRTRAQCLELKQKKQERKEYQKTHISSKHQAGLPLAEGAQCQIEYGENGFLFKSGGNTFNMDFSKINDICIKTDREIQSQYVSSIGGAVGGAVLFGPLGAMIGGRAKKKSTTTQSDYLIFTYTKDGAVDYISFEIFDSMRALKIISDFKKSHGVVKNETIEL